MNPLIIRPERHILATDGGRTSAQMVGPLRTPDPTNNAHAATKQYVDGLIATQIDRDWYEAPYSHANSADLDSRWYSGPPCANRSSTIVLTRGITYITPLWCGHGLDWEFIAISTRVSTAGTTGAVVRLGVFTVNPHDKFKPTALLVDAGTVSSAAISFKIISFASTLATADVEWIGMAVQGEGSDTPGTLFAVQTGAFGYLPIGGWSTSPWVGTGGNNIYGSRSQNAVGDGAFQLTFTDYSDIAAASHPAISIKRNGVFP